MGVLQLAILVAGGNLPSPGTIFGHDGLEQRDWHRPVALFSASSDDILCWNQMIICDLGGIRVAWNCHRWDSCRWQGFFFLFVLTTPKDILVTKQLASEVDDTILPLRCRQITTQPWQCCYTFTRRWTLSWCSIETIKVWEQYLIALCLSNMGANWDDKTDKIIFGFFIFTHETVMHCFQRVKRDFGQVV